MRAMSQPKQLFVVTLCAILIFVLVGVPAYLIKGSDAVFAAVIATGACWTGAVFAVISINILRSTLKKELPWFIMGAVFRMGVPFAVVLVVAIAMEKDFAFPILILFPIVYLLMLPVDVWVMLPRKDKQRRNHANDGIDGCQAEARDNDGGRHL